MASVTFMPAGSQLDDDSIADLQLEPGDSFTAVFTLDTSDLDADLRSLDLRIDQDFNETEFAVTRTDFDTATFPSFELVETISDDGFFSGVFERRGEPGAMPDTINAIVEGEISATAVLNNDGLPDIGVTVLNAIDADGKNVTALFEPNAQAVDLQPFPLVSINAKTTLFVEGGEPQTYTFKLTEPASPGGLKIEVLISDPDMQPDTIPDFEGAQNITNGETIIEDGKAIGRLTIAEGAIEASLEFAASEDDAIEGNEVFSLTLLPGDGYKVDNNNAIVTSVIADMDSAIEGTAKDDFLEGTEKEEAISGNKGNDIISGKQGNDALFGGSGRDIVAGDGGKDLLFGENGADRLFGGNGADKLDGGSGRDTLIGGRGSDVLAGGKGRDRLIGVELNSSNLGFNERDTLIGGLGADTFVLGNEAGVFYEDGDSFASGDADFARIEDLDIRQDKIQLFGSATQYTLDFLPGDRGNIDAKLIYDSGLNSASELIAVLENVTPDLTINDTVFTFI